MILRQVNVELANNQFTKAEYLCSLIHSVTALEKASYVRIMNDGLLIVVSSKGREFYFSEPYWRNDWKENEYGE